MRLPLQASELAQLGVRHRVFCAASNDEKHRLLSGYERTPGERLMVSSLGELEDCFVASQVRRLPDRDVWMAGRGDGNLPGDVAASMPGRHQQKWHNGQPSGAVPDRTLDSCRDVGLDQFQEAAFDHQLRHKARYSRDDLVKLGAAAHVARAVPDDQHAPGLLQRRWFRECHVVRSRDVRGPAFVAAVVR